MTDDAKALAQVTIPVTVWVDRDGRLVEVTMAATNDSTGSISGTVQFSNYNSPVHVSAPAASTVKPAPATVQQLLGSLDLFGVTPFADLGVFVVVVVGGADGAFPSRMSSTSGRTVRAGCDSGAMAPTTRMPSTSTSIWSAPPAGSGCPMLVSSVSKRPRSRVVNSRVAWWAGWAGSASPSSAEM